MEPVPYDLLKTFVAAGTAPTFGAAAKERRVSASSISQQVKALEAQLGVPLFARIGRRVQLTEAGRALLASLRAEFSRIDAAVEEASSAHRAVQGWVALGGPRAFGRYWLRPRVAALLVQHEQLRLRVEFGVPSLLERRLVEGALDLALLSRPTELPNLESRPVAGEVFCLVGAPSYVERYGTPDVLARFEAHRYLVFDGDLPMHAAWWRASFGAGAAPGGVKVAEVACLDEMLSLCEQGAGLAVLPDYLLAESLAAGRLRVIQPETARYPKQRPARNTLFLAWRSGAVASARFVAVREALLAPSRAELCRRFRGAARKGGVCGCVVGSGWPRAVGSTPEEEEAARKGGVCGCVVGSGRRARTGSACFVVCSGRAGVFPCCGGVSILGAPRAAAQCGGAATETACHHRSPSPPRYKQPAPGVSWPTSPMGGCRGGALLEGWSSRS